MRTEAAETAAARPGVCVHPHNSTSRACLGVGTARARDLWDDDGGVPHVLTLGCRCIRYWGMRADRVRGHLRTLLLAAIAVHEPTHGYAVMTALGKATNGYFAFNEGAVYPALHQLEADNLIDSAWDDSTRRRRRVYSLTASGRQQLLADAEDWRQFRDGVETVFKKVPWLNR
jgi:PadR family transcriptional regulator, regulatory protein PadR